MRGGAWLPLTVGLWGSPVPVSEELHSARELMEFTSANSNAKAWRGSPPPPHTGDSGPRHRGPQGQLRPPPATWRCLGALADRARPTSPPGAQRPSCSPSPGPGAASPATPLLSDSSDSRLHRKLPQPDSPFTPPSTGRDAAR